MYTEKRVEFYPTGEGFPNENYFKNGEILREGVVNASCLFVGKVGMEFSEEILSLLINEGEYINSAEFYDSGAVNCFVRYENDNISPSHAVIVVRPK